MDEIIAIAGGGGIGAIFSGITGLVGGWLAKREQRLLLSQQNEHEVRMADIDKELMVLEHAQAQRMIDAKIDLTQTEGEVEKELIGAQEIADVNRLDVQAFAQGLAASQKPTGYPWVDKFRALTRPLITWSLYLFVLVIFIVLHVNVGDLVVADTVLLVKLYVYLVQSVIYLFIMAVSWWFMSRGEKSVKAIRGLIAS